MAEDLKANAAGGKWKTELRNWETSFGGTFHRTFWRPKTDLPQETREITKLEQTWWNFGQPSTEPFNTGPFRSPKTDLVQRTRDSTKLEEPWWNLGAPLLEPWWELPRNTLAAHSFRGTFQQPKTDLPQRTRDAGGTFLPRNLYYG